MPTCFIIQPFDSGAFDKRYEEIYKPALEAAGFGVYRVDKDPSVEVPISAIEDGIRKASICFADITTDNPNVWYELGYARSTGCPVIMVCCKAERPGKYPFDIHHRLVIPYYTDSTGDFAKLKNDISAKAEAFLKNLSTKKPPTKTKQIDSSGELDDMEILLLNILAENTAVPGDTMSLHTLQGEAKRSGLMPTDFGVAFRQLEEREFVKSFMEDGQYHEPYLVTTITSNKGWDWIKRNRPLPPLPERKNEQKSNEQVDLDDEIPF